MRRLSASLGPNTIRTGIKGGKYLDVRWASIKRFISETEPLYKDLLDKVKIYLKKKIKDEEE